MCSLCAGAGRCSHPRFGCFIHSETGSRIFAGCRLLTSRRVDDWVSTYHSWEQPRCPHDSIQLKGAGIHAPARPVTLSRLVQRQPTCPPALLSQFLKDPHLPYVTALLKLFADSNYEGVRGSCGCHHKWVILPSPYKCVSEGPPLLSQVVS